MLLRTDTEAKVSLDCNIQTLMLNAFFFSPKKQIRKKLGGMTGIYLLIYPVSMVIQNHPRLKEISIQA